MAFGIEYRRRCDSSTLFRVVAPFCNAALVYNIAFVRFRAKVVFCHRGVWDD